MINYKPEIYFKNAHLNTIYHSQIRNVSDLTYVRKRFELNDGDFVDLDWSIVGSGSLALVLHGLESSTDRPYMKGMAKALNNSGMDTLCMNFRGCGGQVNRLLRFYHSGDTDDVRQLLGHVLNQTEYENVFMVGFSLGANVLLKFLGEEGINANDSYRISKAAAVSAPYDLASSSMALDSYKNLFYRKRFLRKLGETLKRKKMDFPNDIDLTGYQSINKLKDYDDRYTAAFHGFNDANDYYKRASSKPYLSKIKIPVMIINALDDPFLGQGCYPNEDELKVNDCIDWTITEFGGHVGFSQTDKGPYWHEERICRYFEE